MNKFTQPKQLGLLPTTFTKSHSKFQGQILLNIHLVVGPI